jgi:hypothetical protein
MTWADFDSSLGVVETRRDRSTSGQSIIAMSSRPDYGIGIQADDRSHQHEHAGDITSVNPKTPDFSAHLEFLVATGALKSARLTFQITHNLYSRKYYSRSPHG